MDKFSKITVAFVIQTFEKNAAGKFTLENIPTLGKSLQKGAKMLQIQTAEQNSGARTLGQRPELICRQF